MEDIDSMGYFWRPESPDRRFPGTLSFDSKEGGRLTILAHVMEGLVDANDRGTLFRCVGESGNKEYTLEDCFLQRTSLDQQSFFVNRVVEGAHFEADEPLNFNGASTRLKNLPQWLRISTISEEWQASNAGQDEEVTRSVRDGLVLKVHGIADLSTSIPGGQLTIRHYWGAKGDYILGRQLTQNFRVSVSLPQPEPLADVIDILSDFQDLVSIGSGRVAAFDDLQLYHPDIFNERGEKRVRVPLTLHANWTATEEESKRSADFAFTFDDLGGIEGVQKWMEMASVRRELLGSVMGTRYARRMFSTDRLLHRTAALEALHRERFQNRRKKVTLDTRLKELVAYAEEPFRSMLGSEHKWRRAIVKERNNVAHHLGRPAHINQGAVLYLAESLYWLFVACLLKECSAAPSVFDGISNNGEFNWIRDRVRELTTQ